MGQLIFKTVPPREISEKTEDLNLYLERAYLITWIVVLEWSTKKYPSQLLILWRWGKNSRLKDLVFCKGKIRLASEFSKSKKQWSNVFKKLKKYELIVARIDLLLSFNHARAQEMKDELHPPKRWLGKLWQKDLWWALKSLILDLRPELK